MRPFAVVDWQPPVRDLLHLAECVKGVRVQHLRSKRPIESLDVRVLIGSAWLNVVLRQAVFRTPIDERL